MNDAASFDAILQCNLLEVFCEALGAAIFVTDKLDQISFASIRLLHLFPIRESAIASGGRARDLYGALYDAGLRLGVDDRTAASRDEWVAERIACAWKERVDKIEKAGPERWIRIVSRRFSSGLGLVVIQDVSEQKKKEHLLRTERERVRLTEEILDTLPVAVAVKDRNLTYVAVNQEFCRIIGKSPDALLGHGGWEVLSPDLAGRIEQMDWQLLSNGERSVAPITHAGPSGQPVALERRAQRLGKPGSHYIAVSLVEASGRESDHASTASRLSGVVDEATRQAVPAASGPLRNVLLLTDVKRQDQALKLALRAHDADLCFIRDAVELAAFLPAAAEAGLVIDLVVIDFEFDAAAFNIAAAANLNFRMLPANSDESTIMAEILNALPLPRRPLDPPSIEPPALASEDAPPPSANTAPPDVAGLDVLGVEDNPVNRLVLEQILSSLSLSFRLAGSGMEGLADYVEHRPQLVIADTTLPDLAPVDFAARLRKIDPSAVIIALVPRDTEDNHCQATLAGFAHSLPKPLSAEALGALIPDLLAARRKKPEAPAA